MYPHQTERLTRVLTREGLEALVAAAPANVAYVSGFRSLVQQLYPGTPLFALFTPRGSALIVPMIEVPSVAAATVGVDHVLAYGEFHLDYGERPGDLGRRILEWTRAPHATAADALVAALDRLEVRHGTIGLDDSTLPFDVWHRASERLAPLKVVAAGSYFAEARRVKGPYEIECLGRALGYTEEAANVVIQMLEPGVTERQAVIRFEETLARHGARPVCSIIAFGDHAAIPAPVASDRALRARELVRLELAATWNGYHGSVARTAVMGAPGEREERAYGAVEAAVEAAIRTAEPGRTAGAVFEAATAAARSGGLEGYRRHHVGHGIGLEPFEPPMLVAGEDTALEPGMVLRVEAPYYVLGWGAVTVLETILVAQGGARSLNRSARGLITLD